MPRGKRYLVTFPSGDHERACVSLVDNSVPGTTPDDLFDVALYDTEVVEGNGKTARDNSLAALYELVNKANLALSL